MNLFEIFHTNEYDSQTLLMHEGKDISLQLFKNYVVSGVEFLKKQNTDNVVILSNSIFDFAVWFFACIATKKKIFLLTEASKLRYLNFDYLVVEKNPPLIETKFSFSQIVPENVLINFYTSGSTSTPKHVVKTLSNVLSEAKELYNTFFKDNHKELRFLTSTRLQHMYAFSFCFILPLFSFDKFILDTTEVCYPDDVNFKDSVFVSTPSFLEIFSKYSVENHYSPELIFSAGAKLDAAVFQYLQKYSTVIDIYGCTESGTIAYKQNSTDEFLTVLNNVEVTVGANSQIVVKSPYFMETSLLLGDMLKILDDKHFILTGRADRVFKIQEKRVSAPEIEEALLNYANGFVKDCYCLKVGEKLGCAVVLTNKGVAAFDADNNSLTKLTAKLKSFLKGKTEIIPQKWKFLHEMPKTKEGKIDKLKLEKLFKTNLSLPFVTDYAKDKNAAQYSLIFADGCNFFEGHFNGFHVLPGVVQLYYAHRYAEDAFGIEVSDNCVKKIKFSKIIKPNQKIKLVFERKDNLINYMYMHDDKICSSGVLTINEKD